MKKKSILVKMILKCLGGLCLLLLAVVLIYVGYLLFTYKRIPDRVALIPEHIPANGSGVAGSAETVDSTDMPIPAVGETYSAVTYNIGFGAYLPDYSFFMDGGKYSVAESPESVQYAVNGAASYVSDLEPDIVLWQEVDLNGTRSYHINQYEILKDYFRGYDSVFAINCDSAFLFYPFTRPHGKNNGGMVTVSRFGVTEAMRRSFPISTSFSKFFDLDRCYSVSRVPTENGRELCIFNLHMSAYGNDASIREGQIGMILSDMQAEYEAGNYVLCGGDFNHDLKNLSTDEADVFSWAYPFPREKLSEGFSFCIDQLEDSERENLWDSARNADIEYIPGETFTITLDGFIISDNIECVKYENLSLGYAYSDHDPVYMEFRLK